MSFQVPTITDLRVVAGRASSVDAADFKVLNHGNSWTVYFKDPEDNTVECYVHTPWHISQPYGTPIDFSKSDQEIWDETETASLANPTYMTAEAYRQTIVDRLAARPQ